MHRAVVLIFLFFISLSCLYSQVPSNDTLPVHTLSSIIVTADRFPNRVISSTSSVSVISSEDYKDLPVKSISGIFSLIPGISVQSLDGLGFNPVISMRGFYGGGEAEYALVMVDGVQINDLESGLVNWNFLNTGQISNIEIVRGGASALYGDAAIGGVINITTHEQKGSAFLKAQSFNSYSAGISVPLNTPDNPAGFYISADKTDGFREHSKLFGLNFGGRYFANLNRQSYLRISTNNQITNQEKPGPVPAGQSSYPDRFSSVIFSRDETREIRLNLIMDYSYSLPEKSTLNFQLGYKHKSSDNTNTYTNSVPVADPNTFSPIGVFDTSLFGDTKRRELSINEVRLSAKYYSIINSISARFTAGAEGNIGFYSNKYFNVFNGFEEDYRNKFAESGEQINRAEGQRQNFALYLNSEISPLEKLKLTIGLRIDRIIDSYNGKITDTAINKTSSAFSPKAGLNFMLFENPQYNSSIYINYNQSFKAPAVDQLTDLKQLDFGVFVPDGSGQFMFLPFKASPFANSNLRPQKSSTVELGAYNMFKVSENLSAELSVSVYRSDIKDEIDFDLATLRYGNIDQTRHTGAETSLRLNYLNYMKAFLNFTAADVSFQSGNYKGNTVKGVPGNVLTAGIAFPDIYRFYTGILLNLYGKTYLDDENTRTLDGYSTADFRAGFREGIVDVHADIINVFDRKYSTSGYILNGEKYLYPSAGRILSAGVTLNFK